MKAYLIRNTAEYTPYLKPASAIALKGETVGERLRRQLREAAFEIVESASFEGLKPEAHSIALQDDMLLSEKFLAKLRQHLPSRDRDYHFHMDMAKLPVLCVRGMPPCYRAMPFYYFGAQPKKEAAQAWNFSPSIAFDTDQGMPQRIGDFRNLHIYFSDVYAIQLAHWFDLLTANGLYVREFLVERIRPFVKIIPKKILAWALNNRHVTERSNRIGKGCRIHPTAILEGCVIGDGVEIGPYCYLRSCVIADRAVIREKSSVKASYIGSGASVGSVDVTNCYIGADSFVLSPVINVVIGERTFLAGGSGFADFIFGAQNIAVTMDGKDIPSGLNFLGSGVGDDCFIGAGIGFAPGRTIPSGTYVMNNAMVKNVPTAPNGSYVLSGNTMLQIPSSFIGR